MTATNPSTPAPNHHAHHPPFAGLTGLANAATMLAKRRPVARLAVERTGVGPGDRVVDVGCGPGSAARAAARRGATVTGVDPASLMLRLARLTTVPGTSVDWREGTAEAIPLADGAATVCWSIAAVHHWQDVDRGLAECRRVLAPGGRFLAVERHTRPGATGHASHGWTDDQAAELAHRCRVAGFADVTVATERPGREEVLLVTATRP